MHRRALRVLKADPVMASLMAAAGPCRIEARRFQAPFQALAHAIAHQQLHGVAAQRILARFVALFEPPNFPSPAQVLAASDQQLRAVGFSAAKAAALKDLAAKTLSGVVPTHEELQQLSDLEIIERLSSVRGIGRWTVEMMLMFQLQRPDVLPVGDFGVRNGFRLAYGLKGMPTPRALAQFGERWQPYRSAAAWYLWRAVELSRSDRLPRCATPPRIALVKAAKVLEWIRATKGGKSKGRKPEGGKLKGRTLKRRAATARAKQPPRAGGKKAARRR
jgi:DNA-3-methyladenine glycosylase II